MNSLQVSTPRCTSCIRRLARLAIDGPPSIMSQQTIRGKKKMTKTKPVKVRLLADLDRFGRKGTILSVQPGRMRSNWYPKGLAEYVRAAEIRNLGFSKTDVLDRDANFRLGMGLEEEGQIGTAGLIRRVAVDVERLSPLRATQILSTLLPSHLTFYRTPIAQQQQSPPTPSPSHPPTAASRRSPAVSSAAADLADASIPEDPPPSPPQSPDTPLTIGIYGSVSTGDIASKIRALLAEHDTGSKVALTGEDIVFVQKTLRSNDGSEASKVTDDRVKSLGEFDVEIRIKGADTAVERKVVVVASAPGSSAGDSAAVPTAADDGLGADVVDATT